jgi:prolyl-tRNA synthetase
MIFPNRTVSYVCSVSSNVEECIIRCIAYLSGIHLKDQFQFVPNTTTSSIVRTITNPFVSLSNSTNTSTGIGLMGILRIIAAPELLSNLNTTNIAMMESWINTIQLSIIPCLVQNENDTTTTTDNVVLHQMINELCQQIDTYLLHHHQTILCTDHNISSADIVVVIALLFAAARTTGKMIIPEQIYRYIDLIVHRLDQYIPSNTILPKNESFVSMFQTYIQLGESSPLSLQSQQKEEIDFVVVETKEVTPVPPPSSSSATATLPLLDVADVTTTASEIEKAATTTTTTTTGTSNTSSEKILQLLQEFQLEYTVHDHVPCMTAEELVQNVPLTDPMKETHTKNLILRDKKHGIFLVTISTNSMVNTKELGTLLKLTGKTNLRMADKTILQSIFHVEPGHVGPLCIGCIDPTGNSANEPITVVWDTSLLQYDYIHSHPARNDQSIKLKPSTLVSYAQKLNIEPIMITFTTTTDSNTATTTLAPTPAPTKASVPKKNADSGTTTTAVVNVDKKTAKKGETLLALQWKKDENFAMWYTDVIVLSEMISYYDISGCYILRPWSYKMWELIQDWFNQQIYAMGVENAYFPLFVSQDRLEKEKDHVEGFAPEVAWVTKSGDGDLARPIAIRPTSETIMYPAYSDWIKSHRDLPLKLNQWSNVVRWEFKYPTPFLRTREFLWQEGHTAHSSFDDADATVMAALDLYRQVYEDLLAVPVIPGYKTEKEKFAGGYRTTTVEAYIAGSGRAIQGATSHNLGQNFGKMFDITFQDVKGVTQIAWQTSWGLTTRTIGVMVMVHGDDIGLVLPPRIAPLQVVIVPIISKNLSQAAADPFCIEILNTLTKLGVRVKYDNRDSYNPGWKYNHWEQKGVPIRIEVGPRDIEQQSVRMVIRHSGEKIDVPFTSIGDSVTDKLKEIQLAMFTKAKAARDAHVVQVTEWKDFVPNLEQNNLVLTPWCGGEHQDWEDWVKKTSRTESLQSRGLDEEDEKTSTSVAAKTLCIPFTQPELPAGTKCIASGLDATCWVLWGRSY